MPSFSRYRSARSIAIALLALAICLSMLLALNLSSAGGAAATVRDGAGGIQALRPATWTASLPGSGISLASRDRTVLIEMAAPGLASQAGLVQAAAVRSIEQDYTGFRDVSHASGRLDGLPAQVVVLTARNRAGVDLRILVAAAAGRHLTYLLEVFTSRGAPVASVVDAQRVIDSLRLTR